MWYDALPIWKKYGSVNKYLLRLCDILDHILSWLILYAQIYFALFNIRRALVSNKIVDHLDVVGASPVGAAPITSSFFT